MKRILFALVIPIALLVPSCSANEPAVAAISTTTTVVNEPTQPVTVNATDLANAIKAKVPEVVSVITYTESNDPNNLIGRPNGYTSAALLQDARAQSTDLSNDSGVVIEVFATPEAAQKRSDYIQAILTASPILGSEWNHVSGASLMRVSGKLPPSANDEYTTAWNNGRP